MAGRLARLFHAWNAFSAEEAKSPAVNWQMGPAFASRPDRTRLRISNERSIISSIYTRISVDTAVVSIKHVMTDHQGRYLRDMDSGLNNCLTVEANLDQAARAFRQDAVATLLDEGVIAIVPVDATLDPTITGAFDVQTLRVGRIIQWYPQHVRISVYNSAIDKGIREEITLPKSIVAIVENPLYSVMNEKNSTLQRLIHKLNLLDAVDEQSASGNLDLIIQLPYVIKTPERRQAAEQRMKDIEFQLKGSQYGIAYTDGTEKITQLNRPAENNLMGQIEYLTKMLYGQLGITDEVMNGTADESTMNNYYNRTVEPLLAAISEAIQRTLLTKTGRTQGQAIQYFRNPFAMVSVADLAESADKLTRNEILSSNDFRQIIGYPPSSDPRADQLKNKNIPDTPQPSAVQPPEGDTQNGT